VNYFVQEHMPVGRALEGGGKYSRGSILPRRIRATMISTIGHAVVVGPCVSTVRKASEDVH
jgi:hypothetical protein